MLRPLRPVLLAALLAGGALSPALAQPPEARVLEIRDGVVLLDGTPLAPDAVPEELRLDGLTLHFQFSGAVAPVLRLNGGAYVLEENRLVRFEDAAPAADAEAYGMAQPIGQARERAPKPAAPAEAQELHQARAERAADQADYVRQVSRRDRALYDLLRQERAADAEILQLALRYRSAPDDARPDYAGTLRNRLYEAFDLKMAIRRAEIERAQEQLDAARAQLEERARHREAIVEQRFRELTGAQ